jgi:hypothetical protein
MSNSIKAAGFINYPDETTYLAFKKVVSDKERFGQPYSDWLKQGEKMKKEMSGKGITLVGVSATPEEFMEWCRQNSMEPNASARSAFAAVKLASEN